MADLKLRKGLRLRLLYKDRSLPDNFEGVSQFKFCNGNTWLKISYPDNEGGVLIRLDRIERIEWEDICEKEEVDAY